MEREGDKMREKGREKEERGRDGKEWKGLRR